jgi:hypothetical protein
MNDQKAKDIVSLRDREFSRQQTFRTLWQSVADLNFPQTYGISTKHSPGQELMSGLFDTTAVEESENMASGLGNNLFPAGQRFFKHKAPSDLADDQNVSDYLYYLTEEVHEHIFNSNYIQQTGNTLQYWCTFGTAVNYSDWTASDGLNFRDYAIGTYQCIENSKGIIDTIILTCPMTASQIAEKWQDPGQSVTQALGQPMSQNDEFNVIWVVRPRTERNSELIDNLNMPFESCYVAEKDNHILEIGGFDEFPFAVPRYQVLYREIYGRGLGVLLLPKVRVLNRLSKSYLDMANKWVSPPKEVLETFEGQVDMNPDALNYVVEMGSIKPIDMGASGMYPVTKDILEYYREGIRQGYHKSAFEALTNLTGDRRTTTEIVERLKEGMKKLSKPIGRLFIELIQPQITRATLLLIRNGVVEPPPEALSGRSMEIRLINPLALALEDQQARGGQYWVNALAEAEQFYPGVTDNVDADKWARDLGEALGVKNSHIRPTRDRDKIRIARLEQAEQEQQAMAAQVGSEAYNKMAKAPEEGSPVEQR